MFNEVLFFRHHPHAPFAPAVLAEHASEFFDLQAGEQSPYMLLTAPVLAEKRTADNEQHLTLKGLERLKLLRSEIPAVTHVDYSARVQTVGENAHPRFRRLLQRFHGSSAACLLERTANRLRSTTWT